MRDHVKSFAILDVRNKVCLLLLAEKEKYVDFDDEGLCNVIMSKLANNSKHYFAN